MKLLFCVLCVIVSMTGALGSVTRKDLGDINKDGQPETVVVQTDAAVSSLTTSVTILSGKRKILALPAFSGDTADGYKVVASQIVVWLGDWEDSTDKWGPHYYDFVWYKWNAASHRYEQIREGFTRQSYSFKEAKTMARRLAQKSGKEVVLSRAKSFMEDAKQVAKSRYHRQFNKAKKAATANFPGTARYYMLDSGRFTAIVEYKRNGSVETRLVSGE